MDKQKGNDYFFLFSKPPAHFRGFLPAIAKASYDTSLGYNNS